MAEQDQAAAAPEQAAPEKQISIQKIYVKDFSFESPQAPAVFTKNDWKPQTGLNLRSAHTGLDDTNHEIVLTITIEAKDGDQTLFLVELQQAGLFMISGYTEDEFKAIVGSYCPTILFPYAREAVAGVISKGGFPEFLLQPINFDALYAQGLAQAEAQAQEQQAAGASNGGGNT